MGNQRRFTGWRGLFMAWLMVCAQVHPADGETASESLVKATWVFNFAKYCEWPPTAGSAGSLVIGVLGDDPMAGVLEKVVADKIIESRKIEVRKLKEISGVARVQILFVSKSERKKVRQILELAKTQAILTVSDVERFHEAGGVIAMWVEGDAIRFHINTEAADKAGLRLRAQLLKLSRPAPWPAAAKLP